MLAISSLYHRTSPKTFDHHQTQKVGLFSASPADLELKRYAESTLNFPTALDSVCLLLCICVRSAHLSYQLGPGRSDPDSFVLPVYQPGSHPSTASHPTYVHRTYLKKGKRGKGVMITHIFCVFSGCASE